MSTPTRSVIVRCRSERGLRRHWAGRVDRPTREPAHVFTAASLVQRSFAIIAPIADDAAALFYQRLFELDPSLQRMFPEDMTGQRKKLVQMWQR